MNVGPPYRSVGPAQLPEERAGIRAVAATYNLLANWPRRPDYLDHLLNTGRVAVARTAAGVIGYGGAFVGPLQTHLTDLFVRAERAGRGAGAAILGALQLDPAQTTTFASTDPRAQTLYRRIGLQELDQLSYLVGTAEDVEQLQQRLESITASPEANTEEAMQRHRNLRGGLHGAETLSFLAKTAQPLTWSVGYAWLRVAHDRACVGPVGSEDERAAASLVAAALLEAVRLRPRVQIVVAQSHPAYAALVASGFTISDADAFMAGERSLLDLTRYCPDPDVG